MDNETKILSLSLKDLFTQKMLSYSVAPFVISMVIIYGLIIYFAGFGLEQLGTLEVNSTQVTVENGIPHTDTLTATLQGSAIIQFLLSHAITSWIASFLIYTVGGFISIYLSIFIALLIIGLLTEKILKEIQKRHYPDVEMIGYSNIFEYIFLVIKWVLITIALFILLIPFYFIPLLNIIAFNLPLYYLFHNMITYDVASAICTKEEDRKIRYFYGGTLKLKTLALYLLSLIPFVILFASVFYVIYLGHSYFIEVRKLRAQT
jgi:hypothetical protein